MARASTCAVYFGDDPPEDEDDLAQPGGGAPSGPLSRSQSKQTLAKLREKVDTVYRLDFFRWRSVASLRDDLLDGKKPVHEKSFMNGDHLADVVRADVGGDLTFQEAFDKTGRILNVPVRAVDTVRAGATRGRRTVDAPSRGSLFQSLSSEALSRGAPPLHSSREGGHLGALLEVTSRVSLEGASPRASRDALISLQEGLVRRMRCS